MGCVASKPDGDDDVVSLCRERKRLLKLAVERRFSLADAHCRYNHALCAVAAAIRLFVARHSSPSSPFLITFNQPTETLVSNPMFLQQTPSQSTHEAIAPKSSSSELEREDKEDEEGDEEEEEEEEEEKAQNQAEQEACCENYYGAMPPPMPSPKRDFGWDFFNPFDGVRPETVNGFNHSCDDDLRAIREAEGIPELEEVAVEREKEEREVVVTVDNGAVQHEEDEKALEDANMSQEENRGVKVTDGRELLEALKDVEDHFIRAYDSGLDVSRMLEANKVHLQSGLEEVKENSNKLIQTITWHRSMSSQSSSCKSFLASSSSKSSSTWTEYKNDLFDDYGGMQSGSHSLTLGRLYAWEKKLYDEVKAGDQTRKLYERKCSQLRNRDVRGDGPRSVEKTRAEVKDLYTRILVAIRSAESISDKIEKLRDEELQPQLVELLHGLMRNWKIMSESHETQTRIMSEVKSFTCPAYGKFCSESHRLATLQLEAELQNWRTCFTKYISSQKSYIESLNKWLSKFIAPEAEFYSGGRWTPPPYQIGGPPLLLIICSWFSSLGKLPDKDVIAAMKSFCKNVHALWIQQGEEQQQKRKVDLLAKALERRNRIQKFKLTEVDELKERNDLLDMNRKRVEEEREKHHRSMEETQRIALRGFQMGFSSIFESLTEFSKASANMYGDLVKKKENAKAGEVSNPSYIEGTGSRVEMENI